MSEELEQVLKELADEARSVRSIDLTYLSDLPRGDTARFGAAWRSLSPTRRLELVSTMVDQAEINIRFDFHTILRECLSDADGQIRKLAVDGLWEDERPSLIGRLAAMLTQDPVAEVRAAAATSLGRFVLLGALGEISETQSRQAEEVLRGAWSRAYEVTEVRRRALEGLAYAAGPDVHDLIHAAYYDEEGLMRQSAVFAMGRSADRRWTRFVLAELRSHDAAMRFEAAGSAGELGLGTAVSQLIQLLDDADSNVREASACALGKIGGRDARRALEAATQSDDERLAQAAEEALDELTFNSEDYDEFDDDSVSASMESDDAWEAEADAELDWYDVDAGWEDSDGRWEDTDDVDPL
jgi:HEAT repeat protein